MLRTASSVLRRAGPLRRASLSALAGVSVARTYHSARCPVLLSHSPSAALSSSLASSMSCQLTAGLVEAKRCYARKPSVHDSTTEDISNTFFDVQDVDADRLTHFYWDSNDNADTPYDPFLLDSLLGEGEMDEWSGESLAYVDERDQQLLEEEYLH